MTTRAKAKGETQAAIRERLMATRDGETVTARGVRQCRALRTLVGDGTLSFERDLGNWNQVYRLTEAGKDRVRQQQARQED
jgi:DNA-binding transcriptional regulator PaaX